MPDPHVKDAQGPQDVQTQTKPQERRSQPRNDSVLAQIEDATYAILRKYENKTA